MYGVYVHVYMYIILSEVICLCALGSMQHNNQEKESPYKFQSKRNEVTVLQCNSMHKKQEFLSNKCLTKADKSFPSHHVYQPNANHQSMGLQYPSPRHLHRHSELTQKQSLLGNVIIVH